MTVMDVFNLDKKKISEVELRDDIFSVPVKGHVLHQVVVNQVAAHRSGSAASKTRSAVKAAKQKLWRQKGTGRARVGSAGSPTRRGGGVAFGPGPRNYGGKISKKMKKAALRMALTDKVHNGQLFVVEAFDLPEIKTKNFVGVMENFGVRKALIVTGDKQVNLEKSSQNVPWVKVMRHAGLNVYDLLKYDQLLVEQSAVSRIEEALVS